MKSPGHISSGRIRRGGRAWQAGRRAEWLAMLWLMAKGYWPWARNLRTPFGEIDLVMRRGRSIILVEVKARLSLEAGAQALALGQQRRILRAGAWYLGRHPAGHALDCRCDLVLLAPWRWPRHVMNAWGEGCFDR